MSDETRQRAERLARDIDSRATAGLLTVKQLTDILEGLLAKAQPLETMWVGEAHTLATDDTIPEGQRRWRMKLLAERLAIMEEEIDANTLGQKRPVFRMDRQPPAALRALSGKSADGEEQG